MCCGTYTDLIENLECSLLQTWKLVPNRVMRMASCKSGGVFGGRGPNSAISPMIPSLLTWWPDVFRFRMPDRGEGRRDYIDYSGECFSLIRQMT